MEFLQNLTTNELLTIIAIVIGPVLAVQVEALRRERQAQRERRLSILRALMCNVGSGLNEGFVTSLNLIGLEFVDQQDVIQTWRTYIAHLGTPRGNEAAHTALWDQRQRDMLFDLIYQLSKSLGFKYGRDDLQRGSYTPSGWGQRAVEEYVNRTEFMKIMVGEKAFPITVVAPPAQQAPPAAQPAAAPNPGGVLPAHRN